MPEAPPVDQADPRIADLQEFAPLSIPHASWWLPKQVWADQNLLTEYVRITGVCSLSLLWSPDAAYAACAAAIDQAGRGIIALNYSPYHRLEAESAGHFDLCWAAELLDVAERLEHVRGLPGGNLVQLAILDHERYNQSQYPTVALKLAAMYLVFHEQIATVTWYGQGWWERAVWAPDGWQLFPRTLPTVPHDGLFGVTLYQLNNLTLMRESIRRSAAEADRQNARLAAWVRLGIGYGYEWHLEGLWAPRRKVTYPLANSWRLGFDLAHTYASKRPAVFAPYDRIKLVIFYPAPYGPANKYFHDHFVAYLHGWYGKKMERSDGERAATN